MLPDLHDATLRGIDFVWEARRLRLRLRRGAAHPGAWVLRAEGVTSYSCAARQPWGPSVSINSVDGPIALDGGLARVTIEMQSGDPIVIEAERFELAIEEDRLDAWLDGDSIQIVAVSSFGDPADCGETEARRFAEHILALLAFAGISPDAIGGAPWPEGWQPATADVRQALEAELHRELGADHPLAGKKLVALARRADRDDSLFLVDERRPELVVVHLAWGARPEPSPAFPVFERFATVDAFLRSANES